MSVRLGIMGFSSIGRHLYRFAQESNNIAIPVISDIGNPEILNFSTAPIVSSDIIGNPYSSIYDSECTKVVSGRLARTLNWYDNKWAHSNRVVDLLRLMYNA